MKRLIAQNNVHQIINKLYRTMPLVPVGDLTQDISQDIQNGLYNKCGDPETNWDAWLNRCRQLLKERNIIDVMDRNTF